MLACANPSLTASLSMRTAVERQAGHPVALTAHYRPTSRPSSISIPTGWPPPRPPRAATHS